MDGVRRVRRSAPIAFGLARWHNHEILDPDEEDTVAFREEHPFRPWNQYAVERYGHPVSSPLYSPWQLLPLHDVVRGLETEIPIPVLLDAKGRRQWTTQLGPLLDGQYAAWRTLDERWQPTLKLLVSLQTGSGHRSPVGWSSDGTASVGSVSTRIHARSWASIHCECSRNTSSPRNSSPMPMSGCATEGCHWRAVAVPKCAVATGWHACACWPIAVCDADCEDPRVRQWIITRPPR